MAGGRRGHRATQPTVVRRSGARGIFGLVAVVGDGSVMPQSVYGLTAGDKFLIAATATLVGSALRLPYTMATAVRRSQLDRVLRLRTRPVRCRDNRRTCRSRSAAVGLPRLRAVCGLGGGNFASSMTP
jgi:MFS transporter, NNP family, nitrate/nitrite transporter